MKQHKMNYLFGQDMEGSEKKSNKLLTSTHVNNKIIFKPQGNELDIGQIKLKKQGKTKIKMYM